MGDTNTVLIGTTDLTDNAYIVGWEGILTAPPTRGDLIEMDFTAGATWVAGEPATYTFEIPLVMRSQDPDVAVGNAMAITAAFADGVARTITRKYTTSGGLVTETCTGVITDAIPLNWDLSLRTRIGVVLIVQNLSGAWT